MRADLITPICREMWNSVNFYPRSMEHRATLEDCSLRRDRMNAYCAGLRNAGAITAKEADIIYSFFESRLNKLYLSVCELMDGGKGFYSPQTIRAEFLNHLRESCI